ncbi:hypothetical protein GGD81_003615 [Rhodobium orientis]|uniref:hypothetical protein n=1 Tax=Rhodobium orientis TaxID=34017 RepID=UPI0011B94816|nr:hypothetical protein [Rhodobium orientis]MBB4304555.1 hypothetical protein [Rhodobium orientis]
MVDYLGLAAAVIVLVAALFGLIPPILSGSSGVDSKARDSMVSFIDSMKFIFVIIGLLFIYFLYMVGISNLPELMGLKHGEEFAENIKGLSNYEYNIVKNVDRMPYSNSRGEALISIIDRAIEEEKFPLAILAASRIPYSDKKNEQIIRINRAMLNNISSRK